MGKGMEGVGMKIGEGWLDGGWYGDLVGGMEI